MIDRVYPGDSASEEGCAWRDMLMIKQKLMEAGGE